MTVGTPATARLEGPATAEHAAVVRRFVAGLGEIAGLPPDLTEDLKLAASEVFGDFVASDGNTVVEATTTPSQLELRFEGPGLIDGKTVGFAVVEALFADVSVEDGAVFLRISLPAHKGG
jgi:anti-sigma regulatory factor (Ser/Thr protein kinase)